MIGRETLMGALPCALFAPTPSPHPTRLARSRARSTLPIEGREGFALICIPHFTHFGTHALSLRGAAGEPGNISNNGLRA